jgi:shikimate kinase
MEVNRIVLTGFMGSGKSTVGPLVADRLGFRFTDLDERVEAAAGRPAEAIFLEQGEPLFRALETAVLTQALAEDELVIATGGGALASDATLHMAKEESIVVYLRVNARTLAGRLEADQHRPLLKDQSGNRLTGNSLLERILAIMTRREPFYEQADIIIDAEDMGPPDVAAAVVQAVLRQGVRPAPEHS